MHRNAATRANPYSAPRTKFAHREEAVTSAAL
uniref:Uncharacterized protein n=1 Tax=Ralstonia syzygii R24 TaxID=907261 RepID=G3A2R3_9RALS|nr:hypothetical protein RALSY_20329 [Ralstonia syzygii R24]